MKQHHSNRSELTDPTSLATPTTVIAALLPDQTQADIAVSDLERNGFPPKCLGAAFRSAEERPAPSEKTKLLISGAPTTGFPGWTMGMAPWTITGLGPLVVQGSLSLISHKQRPRDMPGLAHRLGLSDEAAELLESGLRRNELLVTVDAGDKEPIAVHILERNGGRVLPRK